jgi:hypothetical protein
MGTEAQFCVSTVYCCHLLVLLVTVIYIPAQRFIHATDTEVRKRKTQVWAGWGCDRLTLLVGTNISEETSACILCPKEGRVQDPPKLHDVTFQKAVSWSEVLLSRSLFFVDFYGDNISIVPSIQCLSSQA